MFLTSVLATVLAIAGGEPEPLDLPRLAVDPPGRVDLGPGGARELRSQVYRLLNTSAAPIRVRVLDLPPGVTAAGPALEGPIPAGAGAALTVVVDPGGAEGLLRRTVRLVTDDPRQGRYSLPLQLRARPDLAVDGERKALGPFAAHESPGCTFHFTRESGEPLALSLAEPLPPYLEVSHETTPGAVELAFVLRPDRLPPGARDGVEHVPVDTNSPGRARVDLYLVWSFRPLVDVAPTRAVWTAVEPATLALGLEARQGGPVRVLKARLRGRGFRLEGRPGRDGRVLLRRTAPGPARGELVLTFDGVAEPLRVPLVYAPRKVAGPTRR